MRSVPVELALEATAVIGEGPVWDDRTGTLYWIDTRPAILHRFDPVTGTDRATQLSQPLGALGLGDHGGVVLSIEDGFALLGKPEDDVFSTVIEVEKEIGGRRMNDGNVDAAGRYWSGTLAWEWTLGVGSMYVLEGGADGFTVTRVLGGLTLTNGLDWSPRNDRMYYIDSLTERVDVFDFDLGAGRLANRRMLVDTSDLRGRPDGLTVDAEGGIWVAFSGGGCLRRYLPDGTLDLVVALPVSKVTNSAFGGSDLGDLYITTGTLKQPGDPPADQAHAGSVFVCRPGIVGKPTSRFAWV